MQGRERETEWDTVLDDREFDVERKVREGWEKGNQWLEREPVYELDVRLRARLGIARLWMGENDEWVGEAKRHFDLMLEEDVSSFPELFDAVGDAYCERGMYEKALEMFAVMAECEEVSSQCSFVTSVTSTDGEGCTLQTNGASVWLKIGQCHSAMGDFEEARECFENGRSESRVSLHRTITDSCE